MAKLDKFLLTLIAAGIWALVVQNTVQPSMAHESMRHLRHDVKLAMANCLVEVDVTRWGEENIGHILCPRITLPRTK